MAEPRDIGVPVKSANWVRLFAGSDARGAACLYATMGQESAPCFVVRIDLETGRCEKFGVPVAKSWFPTAAYWSPRHERLFVGVAYTGHLVQLDPKADRIEDLGEINPENATFPCRIDEAPDGALWIGSYPGCDLTRFDPETGEFERFGRMDETDMYFYPQCGTDGTVAGLVKMTRPHVVAIDPETGEHRTVGPVADKDAGTGNVNLIKGADGLLYIDSHEGAFRIDGVEPVPVDTLPDAAPGQTLPDGSTFQFLDAGTFEHKRVEITAPDGSRRVLELDWEGEGTGLFVVRNGPDGKIYGSSILPEHLFSYDPKTKELIDHGACSVSGGEAYSMAPMDDKLYICSYPAARLSVYDPALPYRFGTEPGSNPRDYGRMDEVAYRPYAMVCGPAGKVWVGAIPDYGMWGGTLAWFDPTTESFGSHRHVIRDCSPLSLAWMPEKDVLLVGMSIAAGSGASPRANSVALVLWDPGQDQQIGQEDFGLTFQSINDLCPVGDGRFYMIISGRDTEMRPQMLLVDLENREILSRSQFEDQPHGWCVQLQSLFVRGDYVYGMCTRGVFRMPRGTTDMEMVWKAEDETDRPSGPGACRDGVYYFVTRPRFRALELD